ncbi:helix-turn-helix domain-containing protein [Tsukamurella paurometabola]|uniref:Helix-turn-helix transcriptional regulator n=1 Tax=Tsukamurella paurometabola TaxID=2061 RepID=A0ABS5NDX8_TSUPA|nr:helix-turn-helix transcriptional regulator [Tsukamurella paurometabola]MBS4102471.1 helix-turn-helix transcriptional regulator [Tsukamurella paurometabola]
MDDQLVEAILEGGGGLEYLHDVVRWFRREQGDYLWETTKADLVAALETPVSTVNKWVNNPHLLVTKLMTPSNMQKLSRAYGVSYMGLMAATGLVPPGEYDGELPPFRLDEKKGGRRSPIRRPRP